MSTLIIPCLGRKMMNGIPQYLNHHPNGELLLERSVKGIFASEYDKVFIVLLREDVEKYYADQVIKEELKDYPIEIFCLDKMTSGPAETIFCTIKEKEISGTVVIKDADNYLTTDTIPKGNFVAGLDLNTWERDMHNLRNKSFLIVNEQGNLLDIIEKKIRSEVICLGLYGFKSAEDFVKAYEKLNDESYPISSLYVSHIISYLIGYSGKVFRYVKSLEYENWGDERLWSDLQRDYALYFINLDTILGNKGVLTESCKEKLMQLQNRGAEFIGYTVENEEYKQLALKILQNAGLRFLKVIYGCPYSEKKYLINSEKDLERKVIEL